MAPKNYRISFYILHLFPKNIMACDYQTFLGHSLPTDYLSENKQIYFSSPGFVE